MWTDEDKSYTEQQVKDALSICKDGKPGWATEATIRIMLDYLTHSEVEFGLLSLTQKGEIIVKNGLYHLERRNSKK